MGAVNSEVLVELNSMTLKRSPACSRSRAMDSASRACAMDTPSIEPDVSMM